VNESTKMSEILYETNEAITVVTINRPAQRNALNHAVREGLRAAWKKFEADASARVAILTGDPQRQGPLWG
jgi:enoyl-CoA hydratase